MGVNSWNTTEVELQKDVGWIYRISLNTCLYSRQNVMQKRPLNRRSLSLTFYSGDTRKAGLFLMPLYVRLFKLQQQRNQHRRVVSFLLKSLPVISISLCCQFSLCTFSVIFIFVLLLRSPNKGPSSDMPPPPLYLARRALIRGNTVTSSVAVEYQENPLLSCLCLYLKRLQYKCLAFEAGVLSIFVMCPPIEGD